MMESLGSCWPESSSTVMNRNIPAAAVWTNTDVHHIQHQSTGDVIHSKCSDHHQYLSTSTAAAASTQIFDPIDRFETNQLFIQMLQQLAPATDHGECECPVTSRWNINNNNVEASDNLISPSSLVNQQIISSLPGNLIGINDDDIGMGNIRDGPIFDVGGYNSAGSIDQSLECLLSGATTTNSNTDNSMEDDGISIILSDCGNLWSNDPAGIAAAAAVSSAHFHAANDPTSRHHIIADGEKQGTNTITTSHVLHVEQVHHQENLVSISDPHQQIIKKPKSTKRKRHHRQPDVSSSTSSYDHRAHNYFDHQLLRDHLPFNDEGGAGGGFELIVRSEDKSSLTAANPSKRHKFGCLSSSNISFQQPAGNGNDSASGAASEEPDAEAIQQMKEMIYRAAAFRPVNLGLEMVEKPKRKNVKISSDPQTVAARQRREKISERLRVLQKLVPGGSKMDTASMLDEAANYLKFLRSQVKALEALGASKKIDDHNNSSSSRASATGGNYATTNNATDFSDPLPISFHFSNPFTMQSQVHHHHHPHHVQNPNQIPPQPKS